MAEGQARYSLISLIAISTFLYFPLALLGQKQPWEKEWSSQSLEPGASKRRGYNMGQNPGSALELSWRKAESIVSSQTRHTDLSSLVILGSAGEMKDQGWITEDHFVFHRRHYLSSTMPSTGTCPSRGASDTRSPK